MLCRIPRHDLAHLPEIVYLKHSQKQAACDCCLLSPCISFYTEQKRWLHASNCGFFFCQPGSPMHLELFLFCGSRMSIYWLQISVEPNRAAHHGLDRSQVLTVSVFDNYSIQKELRPILGTLCQQARSSYARQ